MAEISRCYTCEPGRTGRSGCHWTSTMQGPRGANCLSWSQCFWQCSPRSGPFPPWKNIPGNPQTIRGEQYIFDGFLWHKIVKKEEEKINKASEAVSRAALETPETSEVPESTTEDIQSTRRTGGSQYNN